MTRYYVMMNDLRFVTEYIITYTYIIYTTITEIWNKML